MELNGLDLAHLYSSMSTPASGHLNTKSEVVVQWTLFESLTYFPYLLSHLQFQIVAILDLLVEDVLITKFKKFKFPKCISSVALIFNKQHKFISVPKATELIADLWLNYLNIILQRKL